MARRDHVESAAFYRPGTVSPRATAVDVDALAPFGLSERMRRDAMVTVAAFARDAGDCRMLLDACGLLPSGASSRPGGLPGTAGHASLVLPPITGPSSPADTGRPAGFPAGAP